MRYRPMILAFLAAAIGIRAADASDLFHLVVDPSGPPAFSDATGRHTLSIDGVADVDPGPDVVPGTIVPTNVVGPNGEYAALFTGAWFTVGNSSEGFATDFEFAPDQFLTVTFWFKTAGNGPYDPVATRYPDRMHALGFGDLTYNLDLDFGDEDHPPQETESACWTYFDGGGGNNVHGPAGVPDRNYYFDDAWHHYVMEWEAGTVRVWIDQTQLGTTVFPMPLGSISESTRNYIGRTSVYTSSAISPGDGPCPWFGYIAGFHLADQVGIASVGPSTGPSRGLSLEITRIDRASRRTSLLVSQHKEGAPRLLVHDVAGRLLWSRTLARAGAGSRAVDLPWEAIGPGGVYFVSARLGDERASRRLVVMP